MTLLEFLIIVIIFGLPIGWIASEFQNRRVLRVFLGLLTIAAISVCVWIHSMISFTFNYNAWYGGATGRLIDTSLQQIEDGHLERTLKIWRGLNRQYHPTYENRARYDELTEEATARLRGDVLIEKGSPWDAAPFDAKTWLGHWEDGFGYWMVIDSSYTPKRPFDIVQAGQPRPAITSISISPDFRVLTFTEGSKWRHTLTLKNKYEASYEWFDLQKGVVWQNQPIYKLIRASDEQKKMTQADAASSGGE